MLFSQLKLKMSEDELVDYSPRDITSKSKQTEALEVVAEADPFEPHHCHPCRRTDDQQATTRDGTVSEEDPEGAVDDKGRDSTPMSPADTYRGRQPRGRRCPA